MQNKSDGNFIIMQAAFEDYKQDSDDKMTKLSEEFKTMFAVLSNQIKTMSSSTTQKATYTPTEPTTVVPANRRDTPL